MRTVQCRAIMLLFLTISGCAIAPTRTATENGSLPNHEAIKDNSPTRREAPGIVITKRHVSSDLIYRGTNVTVRIEPTELFIQKNRGPETVEMLLDYELDGDFIVYMIVEFATPEELGVGFGGGTPVPYYGLRSSSGSKESYFPLSTDHPKGKRYQIVMRRDAGKVSAYIDNHPAQGIHDDLPDPGYICFVMNDVSRVRLHHVRLESPPGQLLIEHGGPGSAEPKDSQP